jgi:hypothetical protein
MRRHESQRQTHKHKNNASPIPKEQVPQKAQKGKRGLNFDANANPHNTPESQGPRWRYTNTAGTENNATNTSNAAKEERRQGPWRD